MILLTAKRFKIGSDRSAGIVLPRIQEISSQKSGRHFSTASKQVGILEWLVRAICAAKHIEYLSGALSTNHAPCPGVYAVAKTPRARPSGTKAANAPRASDDTGFRVRSPGTEGRTQQSVVHGRRS